MPIDVDNLVTVLLASALEAGTLVQHAKSSDEALYLQGCRDTFLALAKKLQQSSPLAVDLFNIPVTVTEEG